MHYYKAVQLIKTVVVVAAKLDDTPQFGTVRSPCIYYRAAKCDLSDQLFLSLSGQWMALVACPGSNREAAATADATDTIPMLLVSRLLHAENVAGVQGTRLVRQAC